MSDSENPYRSPQKDSVADWAPDSIHATLAFILPLIMFLVIASFYPDFTDSTADGTGVSAQAKAYVVMIGVQVLVAAGLLTYFHKTHLRHFPLKFSWLSVVVGVVGVVIWVALCEAQLEKQLLTSIGMGDWYPNRPSFNPFEEFNDRAFLAFFLGIRFILLAIIVPIVEELFIRGWLVRWLENDDWQLVRLTELGFRALAAASVYGVLTHPGEAFAAIAWFSLVTWLMHRTGNLWDCVVAHAVTNFLLGIYVIAVGAWHLW